MKASSDDLLRCEALALEVLREPGIAAAEGRIIEQGSYTFLELRRFDRVGDRRRKPVLSIAALMDHFIGTRDNWAGAGWPTRRPGTKRMVGCEGGGQD